MSPLRYAALVARLSTRPRATRFENERMVMRMSFLLLLVALAAAGARASTPSGTRQIIAEHRPLPTIDEKEPDPPVWPRSYEVRERGVSIASVALATLYFVAPASPSIAARLASRPSAPARTADASKKTRPAPSAHTSKTRCARRAPPPTPTPPDPPAPPSTTSGPLHAVAALRDRPADRRASHARARRLRRRG